MTFTTWAVVATVGFATFVGSVGVIWKSAIKPLIEGVQHLVAIGDDMRDLLVRDEMGRLIPERVVSLEAGMTAMQDGQRAMQETLAAFITSLGPMVTAIAKLAGPAPRGSRTASRTRKDD